MKTVAARETEATSRSTERRNGRGVGLNAPGHGTRCYRSAAEEAGIAFEPPLNSLGDLASI